jgi:glycosyltransferase involved in cell wall biosynthesis
VIRVAMTMPGHGLWTGGENYLLNMLAVIRDRVAGSIEPIVFLTPEQAIKHGEALAALVGQRLVIDPAVADFGRGKGLKSAIVGGVDREAAVMFAAQRCTAVFETAAFYGWRFPLPVLAWIPDFQHRYMPQMFTRTGWLRREAGFRAQIATGRTVMLSSQTACDDAERFYPAVRGRTAVVSFAQAVDIAALVATRALLKSRYDLPSRFTFLPNQFWKHKNHILISKALGEARRRGVLNRLPPILMTGRQDDIRNPNAYPDFQRLLLDAAVAGHVRHLGLIPYRDVLGLVLAADAILNPSFFEGWSTTVEEAKALGAPLVISDIPIHREQAPDARFFGPESAGELLEALLAIGNVSPRPGSDVAMLMRAQDARLETYATAMLAAFELTIRSAQPKAAASSPAQR